MNWSVLRLLFIHEMKMLLRARRTVVTAIVLPALIMPLMLYAQKYSSSRRESVLTGTTYRYTITGPLADRIRNLIQQTREGLNKDTSEELAQLRQFKFVEMKITNARESLDRDAIHFYIETIAGKEADKIPPKVETAPRGPVARRNLPPKRL